jgi:hypothetical protein
MAESKSLADEAVAALAAVRAMDEGMDMTHPERHSVRSLKQTAQDVLLSAFRQAQTLAYLATDLTALVDNVKADEAKRALDV